MSGAEAAYRRVVLDELASGRCTMKKALFRLKTSGRANLPATFLLIRICHTRVRFILPLWLLGAQLIATVLLPISVLINLCQGKGWTGALPAWALWNLSFHGRGELLTVEAGESRIQLDVY